MASVTISFEGAEAPTCEVLVMDDGQKFINVRVTPDVTLAVPGFDKAGARWAVLFALELLVAAAECRGSKDDEPGDASADATTALLRGAVETKAALDAEAAARPPVCDGEHLGAACADPQCWQHTVAEEPSF